MSISNGSFKDYAAREGNPGYEKLIARQTALYEKPNDCRDPFERDYTRILHSTCVNMCFLRYSRIGPEESGTYL